MTPTSPLKLSSGGLWGQGARKGSKGGKEGRGREGRGGRRRRGRMCVRGCLGSGWGAGGVGKGSLALRMGGLGLSL